MVNRKTHLYIIFACCVALAGAAVLSAAKDSSPDAVPAESMLTHQKAIDSFNAHEAVYKELVALISQCKGIGTAVIYPDGKFRQSNGQAVACSDLSEIVSGLKENDILWVIVSSQRPHGGSGPFSAMFVIESYGLLVDGWGSAIYYFPEMTENPFGDSTPLDNSSGHWFARTL